MVTNLAPNTIREALRKCRLSFGCVGLFSVAINALFLTVSLYMLQVYDRVLTSRSLDTLLYLTTIALGALLVLGLLEIARSRVLLAIGVWLEQTVAPHAFEASHRNSLRGRAYRGEALRDVRELRAFLGGPGILVSFDMPAMPLFLGAVFALHPLLGIIAAAAAAALSGLAMLTDFAARRLLTTAADVGMRSMRLVEACSRNAEIVDGLGMTAGLMRRWAQLNHDALELQTVAGRRTGIIAGLSKFLRLAVQVLMLGAGAYLFLQQELTGGAMIAASIILARALAPIEQAIGTWKQTVGARAAYQRLKACLTEPPLRPVAMPLPAPLGRISSERVSFALAGGRALVRNIAFELATGEALAVIGPSASGKSTLARLLVGIHAPSGGRMRLDGADIFPQSRERLAPISATCRKMWSCSPARSRRILPV